MKTPLRLALVGDYHPDIVAHQAIPLAIDDAAAVLEQPVKNMTGSPPRRSPPASAGGVRCHLGRSRQPVSSPEGAFTAIRYARENSIPFLGTCGGFQHAVIEYARNVLGWQDAGHAETDSEGRMVIAPSAARWWRPLPSSSCGRDTLIARAYGRGGIEEGYHCRYGVSSAFAAELEQGDLRVTGWDEEGEIRAVRLVTHPFLSPPCSSMGVTRWTGVPRRWCRRFSAPRHNNSTGGGRCRSSSGVNFPVTSGEARRRPPSPAKSAPPPAAEYASRHWHHGSLPISGGPQAASR